jgi:hypothetical protein
LSVRCAVLCCVLCCVSSENTSKEARGAKLNLFLAQRPSKKRLQQLNVIKEGVSRQSVHCSQSMRGRL